MSSPYNPSGPNQQQPQQPYPPGGYAPQGGYAPFPQSGGFPPPGPRGYLQGGPVGFGQAISEAFRNMFNYQGRASRSAYWWFALFMALVYVVLIILGLALKGPALFIDAIVDIGMLLTVIPLTVRRLHDQDKSGFWYFIAFVPFVGGIWLFVLTLLEGTPGPNRFG